MSAMRITRSRIVVLLAAAGIVALVAGPALAEHPDRVERNRTSCWQSETRTTVVYVVRGGYATSGGSRLVVVAPQPWRGGSVIFGRSSVWGRHSDRYSSRRRHHYRSRGRGHYSNRTSRYSSGRRGSGFRFTFGF